MSLIGVRREWKEGRKRWDIPFNVGPTVAGEQSEDYQLRPQTLQPQDLLQPFVQSNKQNTSHLNASELEEVSLHPVVVESSTPLSSCPDITKFNRSVYMKERWAKRKANGTK